MVFEPFMWIGFGIMGLGPLAYGIYSHVRTRKRRQKAREARQAIKDAKKSRHNQR